LTTATNRFEITLNVHATPSRLIDIRRHHPARMRMGNVRIEATATGL